MGGMGRRPRDPLGTRREQQTEIAALHLDAFEMTARALYEDRGLDVEGARLVIDHPSGPDPDNEGMHVEVGYHWEWPDGRRYPPLPQVDEG